MTMVYFSSQKTGIATRTEEWEVQTEHSQAAMREETELLSNTLKEVAKAILKDTEDSGKFVDGKSKGTLQLCLQLCEFRQH